MAQLAPQHFVFDDLAAVQILELVEGALDQVVLVVRAIADAGQFFFSLTLLGLDLGVFSAVFFELLDVCFELLETSVDIEVAVADNGQQLFLHFGFEVGKVGVATPLVDERHEVGCEVDDLFELLRLQFLASFGAHEEIRQPAARATEIPDVHHGS